VAESFGTLLRKCRAEAGISLGELSRLINYSKGYVSKIESGQKPPNAMFAKLCDQALGTDGVLAAAVPPRVSRADEQASPDEVWVLALDESGSLQFAELPRRQVLAGAGALLGYAIGRNARPVVDAPTLTVLRASFDHYRKLGTMTSPAVVLAPVIAHVHTLRTLAGDNPEPMRSELLLLASRVAEFAGWMSQEAGREADALRWTERAVSLADGRDPHLRSFALFRQAEVALYQHDPARTVELARLAQQDVSAGPRILGLAARCEAQGHALAGDVRSFEEALARAADLLSIQEPTAGPVLGSASVVDEVALARGWALYDLGRPGDAAELLDQQLAVISPAARRARARFGIRRALAHAQNGDIDQACVAAREVLADAAQVDSATIRLDLRELSRTLGRWHNHPAAVELRHELLTVLGSHM
jgi:transcriptional regulator with XRE-family HTH domain